MKTRLPLIDSQLDRSIKKYTPEHQRKITLKLLELLAARFTISDFVVVACVEYLRKQETVPADIIEKLKSLIEDLDAQYLSLQERYEEGNESEDDLNLAFSIARCASAVFCATNTDTYIALAETIYEATSALDGLVEIRNIIQQTTF